MNPFSDEVRRNPYPFYQQMRAVAPLFHVPPPFNGWMVFDYEAVKWVLNDPETFSSAVPAPKNWFVFSDPPAHTKQRGLISRAFTPRMIANLEPRIRELSRELLDGLGERREIDLAAEFSVPLPMKVIAGMIGIPVSDWALYKRWSDTILRISYSRSGGPEAAQSLHDFMAVSEEMNEYLGRMIAQRRAYPQDDLLTRLIEAEVDGERLTQAEILGFFQLLVVAGQETTTDLINNAMVSLLEHPDQMARLRAAPELMASAIEEALRYRSPFQWTMRTPRREVELHGQKIPAGALVLPMMGSANRDPKQFADPERFDIARNPNPHVAFGHGIHFCLGAALSRMEAKIVFSDLMARFETIEFANDQPLEPRKALHVLGPAALPIRLGTGRRTHDFAA
ncbi:MAG TPA: cytochrome P450 [Bryobacteraceae bacterium]|nr:cytochrome P450 [Bryobacteraceae bacterium]